MGQIASSNIGYSGGKNDAVYHYHSVYDSFTWMEKCVGPSLSPLSSPRLLGISGPSAFV